MKDDRINLKFPRHLRPTFTKAKIEALRRSELDPGASETTQGEVIAEALNWYLDAVAVARGHGLEPADVFAALDRYLRFATKAGAKDRAAVERIIAATLEAEDERTAGEAAAAERKLRDRSA